MESFNINNVLTAYSLSVEDAAKVLYPKAKYPKQAFSRVLKGEAYLDTKQVEDLAKYLGVLVGDLFNTVSWTVKYKDESFIFSKGEYSAKLTYKNLLTVYKNNVVIYQSFSAIANMSVNSFINHINNIIKNHE